MTLSKPTRNLALEIVRVTEAAALAAGRWMGRGAKEKADHAAVEAMRLILSTVDMNGIIVIGEGEKDGENQNGQDQNVFPEREIILHKFPFKAVSAWLLQKNQQ